MKRFSSASASASFYHYFSLSTLGRHWVVNWLWASAASSRSCALSKSGNFVANNMRPKRQSFYASQRWALVNFKHRAITIAVNLSCKIRSNVPSLSGLHRSFSCSLCYWWSSLFFWPWWQRSHLTVHSVVFCSPLPRNWFLLFFSS